MLTREDYRHFDHFLDVVLPSISSPSELEEAAEVFLSTSDPLLYG